MGDSSRYDTPLPAKPVNHFNPICEQNQNTPHFNQRRGVLSSIGVAAVDT